MGAAGEESDADRERTPMRERLLVGTGDEAVDEREGTLHRRGDRMFTDRSGLTHGSTCDRRPLHESEVGELDRHVAGRADRAESERLLAGLVPQEQRLALR